METGDEVVGAATEALALLAALAVGSRNPPFIAGAGAVVVLFTFVVGVTVLLLLLLLCVLLLLVVVVALAAAGAAGAGCDFFEAAVGFTGFDFRWLKRSSSLSALSLKLSEPSTTIQCNPWNGVNAYT